MVMSAGFDCERLVDGAGIALLEAADIVAALRRLLQLRGVAEIGPDRVVELEVAAAGIVEGADRLAIGGGRIGEELVDVRVDRLDGVVAGAEVEDAGARDRHLRHEPGVVLEETEVGDHRMIVRPADPAGDRDGLRLGLDAMELDAVIELHQGAAVEPGEEIEMPPGAAELAVRRGLEADLLLPPQDLLDLAILDGAEFVGGDAAFGAGRSSLFQRIGAQQAADHVGAEWRLRSLHGILPPIPARPS